MRVFKKTCFGHTREIPFRSSADFDEHAVAQVFCSLCSDRAPGEALSVAVTGVPGWSGVYAIDWNQGYLEHADPKFRDREPYYSELFRSGRCSFGFLPREHAERSYTVLGIREGTPSEVLPAGPDQVLMKVSGMPALPRKKGLRGPEEAKRHFSGYKGHR